MIYTKDWILSKDKTGLSVHKYSYSHEKLRKKTKRMCKDGVDYGGAGQKINSITSLQSDRNNQLYVSCMLS